eukprot:1216493-Amorphochlora_amoeboformis.AAC.1
MNSSSTSCASDDSVVQEKSLDSQEDAEDLEAYVIHKRPRVGERERKRKRDQKITYRKRVRETTRGIKRGTEQRAGVERGLYENVTHFPNSWIDRATHATNLGIYVGIYKLATLVLKRTTSLNNGV